LHNAAISAREKSFAGIAAFILRRISYKKGLAVVENNCTIKEWERSW
jgi:hypothetical protein